MTTLAILIWPICAFIIGRTAPFAQALIYGTLVPYLFLPQAFAINMPGLPDIDKFVVISLGLLIIFFLNREELDPPPKESEAPLLRTLLLIGVIMLLTAPLITVVNNQEPVPAGPVMLPALKLKDGLNYSLEGILALVPYFLARRYLSTPEAHRQLLTGFVVMGLIYSALMLVELRLSPQLHNWVYGYHPHHFNQHIRGGFRPMMFLQHGLFVGFFIFMCMMAALGLWKSGQGFKWLIAALWLFGILLISKNLGASIIAVLVIVGYLGIGRWLQIIAAMSIAFVVFLFPMFRSAGYIPIEQITAGAAMLNERRAQSLQTRLDNEDLLLERAMEKPVTGWGRWGRNHVYSDEGKILTIQEGVWIQAIAETGWYGYLGLFAVLTLPVMFAIGLWRRKNIPPETFALLGIMTGNLIYMVPTTTLTPAQWIVFGAFAGFALTRNQDETAKAAQPEPEEPVTQYTRFAGDRKRGAGQRAGAGVRSMHRRPANGSQ